MSTAHILWQQLGNATGNGTGGGGGGGCDIFEMLESLCLEDLMKQTGPILYVFEILVLIYCFFGLAIVCDDYLAISLETLCDRWGVREDVAGASFMAFGSAAPEITINLVTSLKSLNQQRIKHSHGNDASSTAHLTAGAGEGDTMDVVQLGCSAILGSGLIAFLIIPGVCALSADADLELKRRPLLRDVLCYSISLTLLCLFMRDGLIETWEGGVLVSLYGVYLLIVILAPYLRRAYHAFILGKDLLRTNFVRKQREEKKRRKEEERARRLLAGQSPGDPGSPIPPMSPYRSMSFGSGLENKIEKLNLFAAHDVQEKPQTYRDIHQERNAHGEKGSMFKIPRTRSYGDVHRAVGSSFSQFRRNSSFGNERDYTLTSSANSASDFDYASAAGFGGNGSIDDEEEDGEATCVGKTYDVIVAPLRFVFRWTCPDCEIDGPMESWYPLTFLSSFVWVALFSFIISTIIQTWADHTQLTPSFFGLYLISIGAEVPDTIQSVAVARRGFGSMAVSNSTGSQIVNILIGLGLPWFLSALAGHPIEISGHQKLQDAAYFLTAAVVLCTLSLDVCMLFVPVVVNRQNKAYLTHNKGIALLLGYVVIAFAYLIWLFVHHDI